MRIEHDTSGRLLFLPPALLRSASEDLSRAFLSSSSSAAFSDCLLARSEVDSCRAIKFVVFHTAVHRFQSAERAHVEAASLSCDMAP